MTFQEIAERANELQDHEAPTHTTARINKTLELIAELAQKLSEASWATDHQETE